MFPISSNTDESSVYVDDVFSTWLYTGNGSTQTITNGIDLAGKGGMVWIKNRSGVQNHVLFDTPRGTNQRLSSNLTDGNTIESDALNSFNANGFSIGSNGRVGTPAQTYASWTFRKAAKFFDVVTYTGTGSARTIAHSLGVAPGMVIVKRADTTGDWQVYSNGLTSAANSIQLTLSAAQASAPTVWNSTAPTSSVFSVGTSADVNASGGTYVAYLYAHDTSSTGIIQCGSYVGTTTVTLGWEPQYLLLKQVNSGSSGGWFIVDSMRGFAVDAAAYNGDAYLYANGSSAEVLSFGWEPTSTGFTTIGQDGRTMIYMAIRRPNKPPTTGTQVYKGVLHPSSSAMQFSAGFPPDLVISMPRAVGSYPMYWYDRLRGIGNPPTGAAMPYLTSTSNVAEATTGPYFYMGQDGFAVNTSWTDTDVIQMFKRAPGFFDIVCYTGNGTFGPKNHNLGAVPELMITKRRDNSQFWWVLCSAYNDNSYGKISTTDAFASPGAYTWIPTATTFTPSASLGNDTSGGLYVSYIFATLAGISKVGSYTGTNASLNINCGFAAGARFIMIKRTDSTGDWYVWDSARGITVSTEPHLSLNTTAAQVTDDSINPHNPGFTVNANTAININVLNATYIFLAIA